jgi:MFS family permease
VPLAERGKYGGIIGGVFAIAYIVGPLLGGVFTEKASWRWAFYFNLPTGAITVAIVLLYLSIPTPVGNVLSKLKRVDYGGCVLIVAALTCLVLAFTWAGGAYAWGSGVVVGLLVTGVVLSVGFVVYESKVEESIVPPRLFHIRNVALCFTISTLINMTYESSLYYIPFYYQVIRGDSALVSGMKLLPLMLTIPIFAWVSGYFMERLNVINIWMQVGTFLLTVGMTLLYTLDTSSSLIQEIVYMLLVGIGVGNTISTATIGAQAATCTHDLAVVTGIMSFSQNAGGMFGITLAGVIFNNVLAKELTSRLAGLPGMTPEILQGVQKSVLILRQQSPEIQQLAQEGYMAAFKLMFLALMPFVALAFLLSLLLENRRLCKTEETVVACT